MSFNKFRAWFNIVTGVAVIPLALYVGSWLCACSGAIIAFSGYLLLKEKINEYRERSSTNYGVAGNRSKAK